MFKANVHTYKLLFLATTLGFKRYFIIETLNILSTLLGYFMLILIFIIVIYILFIWLEFIKNYLKLLAKVANIGLPVQKFLPVWLRVISKQLSTSVFFIVAYYIDTC